MRANVSKKFHTNLRMVTGSQCHLHEQPCDRMSFD